MSKSAIVKGAVDVLFAKEWSVSQIQRWLESNPIAKIKISRSQLVREKSGLDPILRDIQAPCGRGKESIQAAGWIHDKLRSV
ncbi:hypothetical protein EM20IM_06090 [Candidatus Methylacidiphilum infernorum]|uniref:Uncharacterized protein n=1 Tax=Candidatus Methylacidiphilum infernorum TaxID=511746 RepID=A0ABX7PU04_9BACT|nr:hypothetical protein [Candidatus Methylacidiphilum infernorum]QSR86081.1 hypothetical protein EM20IM_06090 [Candidatus Methylacidiphilum infernorum]